VLTKFDSEAMCFFIDRKGEKQTGFVNKLNHSGVDSHRDFDAFGYFACYYVKRKQVAGSLRLAHDCYALHPVSLPVFTLQPYIST
jgi:hypothetical protein